MSPDPTAYSVQIDIMPTWNRLQYQVKSVRHMIYLPVWAGSSNLGTDQSEQQSMASFFARWWY